MVSLSNKHTFKLGFKFHPNKNNLENITMKESSPDKFFKRVLSFSGLTSVPGDHMGGI